MGAKWDKSKKRWYITPKNKYKNTDDGKMGVRKLILKYKQNIPQYNHVEYINSQNHSSS